MDAVHHSYGDLCSQNRVKLTFQSKLYEHLSPYWLGEGVFIIIIIITYTALFPYGPKRLQ